MVFDLLIIGGGASGLAAAVTAKALGIEKIAVLERLSRVGKKILATGNGRCNLSHERIEPEDFRGSVDVTPVLEKFGDVKSFFENLGLYTRTDSAGRMYPYSMAATSVLDAFRLRMREDGIEEICDTEITELCFAKGQWHARTTDVDYAAPFVIFSTGGYAAPKLGTDGSAWDLLKKLDIPVVSPTPNLCPVLSDEKILRPLKGLRVKGEITLYDRDEAIRTEIGEVQFTEKALSGICVFNLSGMIDIRRFSDHYFLFNPVADLGIDLESILCTLQGTRFGMTSEEMLSGLLPKPIARLALKNRHIPADFVISDMDYRQIQMLAAQIRSLHFPVRGLAGFEQAQSTRGGIPGNALDANLQVKAHKGLFVTGEACDVHANCGGYHLHWAWASGAAAATAIAEQLCKK
ncbi:MAG: aminoacetone oxidase family FAD-binding enzyme [Oscillospiraceae bacterium]|nr:aminoacetone oxidase family FAD-binding enzyme [Oscillospiraceae bacterium]